MKLQAHNDKKKQETQYVVHVDELPVEDDRIKRQDSNEYFEAPANLQQSTVLKSSAPPPSVSTWRTRLLDQDTVKEFPEVPVSQVSVPLPCTGEC